MLLSTIKTECVLCLTNRSVKHDVRWGVLADQLRLTQLCCSRGHLRKVCVYVYYQGYSDNHNYLCVEDNYLITIIYKALGTK